MGTGGGAFDTQDRVAKNRLNQKTRLCDSGANIAALASPQQGANAYCTSAGSGFGANRKYDYDGSRWVPDNPFRRIHMSLPPLLGFYDTGGAGTETITQISGGIQLETGATSGNDAYLNPTNLILYVRGDRAFEWGCLIDVVYTTATEIEVGVSDQATPSALLTSAANHFTFVFDKSTSDNWITRNANTSAQTTNTSSTAVTAGTHWLSIINYESKADFYVDGTFLASHSTNLPTTAELIPAHIFVQTEAAAAKTMRYFGVSLVADAA